MADSNKNKIELRNEIEKKIENQMHLDQNSSHLKMMYQLYKELESTYAIKKYSPRLINLLCYIIDGAYRTEVTDSIFVVNLLHNLLEINGTFLPIFTRQFGSHDRIYLPFFLDHANRQKSIFYGYRLLSSSLINCIVSGRTWIEYAVLAPCPKSVHYLLRYGALYCYSYGYAKCTYVKGWEHVRLAESYSESRARFCARLIYLIIRKYIEYRPRIAKLDARVLEKSTMLFECGRLVMKDIPLLKLSYISCEYEASNILHQLSDDIPLLENFFRSPLSLKHACRLTIRKALYDNWHLPHGIGELQIPNCLKEYLDLKDDF